MRRWTQAPDFFKNILAKRAFPSAEFCSFSCVHSNSTNSAVGNLRVRRVTNKNINQGPVGETDDLQTFASRWNTAGAILKFTIWSTSVTAAVAIATAAIEEAGLNDRAGHFHTMQDSEEVKPNRKVQPAPKDGDVDLYLLLTTASGGNEGFHFLRLASCGSTSETVNKALNNIGALDHSSSDVPGPKAYMIDFGKCLLFVFRPSWS